MPREISSYKAFAFLTLLSWFVWVIGNFFTKDWQFWQPYQDSIGTIFVGGMFLILVFWASVAYVSKYLDE